MTEIDLVVFKLFDRNTVRFCESFVKLGNFNLLTVLEDLFKCVIWNHKFFHLFSQFFL